jgi:acyl-CoA synthetase (AMP-forming)/AMP-acid ligase II
VTANRYLARVLDHFAARGEAPFCRLIGERGEETLTWADLERLARRFIATYRAAGLRPGDTILIFLRHGAAQHGAFFGAMLGGLVPAFMPPPSPRQNPALYWRSHQLLLEQAPPAAIVADRATFGEMEAAGLRLGHARALSVEDLAHGRGEVAPPPGNAVALLQHSSGTTGLKKGVALSYDAILAQVESFAAALRLGADDVAVSWLPLYHDMGLIACLVAPAFAGATIVQIDTFVWLARPALLFEAIATHGGTLAWLPNFAFEHLVRVAGRRAAAFDLSRVRAFINCSEPCRAATFDRFLQVFAPAGIRADQLQCCYAMAETVFAVTQTKLGIAPRRLRFDPEKLGVGDRLSFVAQGGLQLLESGEPVAGADITIYDRERRPLGEGAVGEIGIRAPFLFTGYNHAPERTAKVLADGTYYSGDLGFLHQGHLYVLGRADDAIVVNGRNLYPHEIESVLGDVDGLKPGRNFAAGLFDERIGSETLILICEWSGDDGAADDLVARVTEIVASVFEVTPRHVRLVSNGWLAKTTSGKVSRNENLPRFMIEAASGV